MNPHGNFFLKINLPFGEHPLQTGFDLLPFRIQNAVEDRIPISPIRQDHVIAQDSLLFRADALYGLL
jgi:hypothetical protein